MFLKDFVASDQPYVIFKKPGSGQLHIWQQTDDQLHRTKDINKAGFYFVPFNLSKHPLVIFPENQLKKEQYFSRDFDLDRQQPTHLKPVKLEETVRQNHLNQVQKAIDLIAQKELDKIVVSRKQSINFENFNPFNAVLKLMRAYDQSFVYLWHHPKIGSWMGATPELLAGYQKPFLKTMALAGTLPVNSDEPVAWHIKEIKEQQIVTDYIISQLEKEAKSLKIGQPETVYQGQLAHIKTSIEAELPDAQALSKLILKLHPTPAVCGLPQEKAKYFINQIETYDREYYTGFLGYHSQNRSNFYVNLRSMKLLAHQLELFIGGGIVAGSNPNQEWEETLIKSEVLLSIIK